ncbi:MAG TPA: DUF3307 domain-containing protein [Gaiellaceae bacterium]|nr:DUF3307 domain-containing protein [Gaiellaceae bacterium]
MSWEAVSLAFLGSHLAGDFLFQTDWQARRKHAGLGRDSVARRALGTHVLTYLVAFVPALVWLASGLGAWKAVGVAALVAVPHLAVDDRRVVELWVRRVKRAPELAPEVQIAVDQSFHVLCLIAVALLVSL